MLVFHLYVNVGIYIDKLSNIKFLGYSQDKSYFSNILLLYGIFYLLFLHRSAFGLEFLFLHVMVVLI